jgi:hypothetical protein
MTKKKWITAAEHIALLLKKSSVAAGSRSSRKGLGRRCLSSRGTFMKLFRSDLKKGRNSTSRNRSIRA